MLAGSAAKIGGHYHRKKDEVFLLVVGKAISATVGWEHWQDVAAPHRWVCPAGTYHDFELESGSILLGVATAPFDPADEHSGHPAGLPKGDFLEFFLGEVAPVLTGIALLTIWTFIAYGIAVRCFR